MRLLIVTQIVDRHDPVLGFFHGWLAEFAKRAEKITVICLRQGEHDLPENVTVVSLGKERAPASRAIYAFRLGLILWRVRREYDSVLVHMNPEYVALAGLWWRLSGKRIGLWYAHGAVTRMLRIALRLAHMVFTSTPHGFRIASPKVRIVGQGIDTELFSPKAPATPQGRCSLVTVSRLARSKNIATVIEAAQELRRRGIDATLEVIGEPLTEADRAYEAELRTLAGSDLNIRFIGGVPNPELPAFLDGKDFLVNAYENQSLDKALLEAMAMKVVPVSSNSAYCALMTPVAQAQGLPPLCVSHNDPARFAEAIMALRELPEDRMRELRDSLRTIVVREHGISGLILKIVDAYGTV
jgi:glycosyltransferase involved in cell wall biosynthesis